MKEFNLEEYNKMCSEFLGGTYHSNLKRYWFPLPIVLFPTIEELKFDSDWNWIMKVCTKINSINVYKNNPSDTTLATIREELRTFLGLCNKEAVVQAIWEFLNWYKENKE